MNLRECKKRQRHRKMRGILTRLFVYFQKLSEETRLVHWCYVFPVFIKIDL